MKLYVSGPINGLTVEQYTEAFARGSALVLSEDHVPVNPLNVIACHEETCNPDNSERLPGGKYLHSWACYLKYDIIEMLQCDGIALLPNWRKSQGAAFEQYVAEKCGLAQFTISEGFTRLESHS